jgi:hypothetical protein
MKLYREGTMIKGVHGDLWMIVGYCKNSAFPTQKMPNSYDLVRLKDGFRRNPVFRMVHHDYRLVSET